MPMIASSAIHEELQGKIAEGVLTTQSTCDAVPTYWAPKENVHDLLRYLKDEVSQPYRMLYDLTAIDDRPRKHRDNQLNSDFTVVYHLLSFDRNQYVRIK